MRNLLAILSIVALPARPATLILPADFQSVLDDAACLRLARAIGRATDSQETKFQPRYYVLRPRARTGQIIGIELFCRFPGRHTFNVAVDGAPGDQVFAALAKAGAVLTGEPPEALERSLRACLEAAPGKDGLKHAATPRAAISCAPSTVTSFMIEPR